MNADLIARTLSLEAPGKILALCVKAVSEAIHPREVKTQPSWISLLERKRKEVYEAESTSPNHLTKRVKFGLEARAIEVDVMTSTPDERGQEEIRREGAAVTEKAVKAGGVAVPEHLWDDRVFDLEALSHTREIMWETPKAALKTLREKILFPFWRKKVERDFVRWFKATKHASGSEAEV
jgi:glycerol-3-phosphate O-acyltransferase